MTIINKLAELQRDLEKGSHNLIASNYLTDKDVGNIMNDLSELKWWREQELIDRHTLLGKMGTRYEEKVGIVPDNLAEGFMQMEKLIKQIPKAEYTGEQK